MKKADALKRWKDLPDSDPLGKMTPIPYKARGSRYGACGIRIDGNPAFIDAVLSKLKTLLDGENHYTRLELARNVVDGSGIGKALPNADTSTDGAPECCYVRLHVRGSDASTMSALFDKSLDGATRRFAESV